MPHGAGKGTSEKSYDPLKTFYALNHSLCPLAFQNLAKSQPLSWGGRQQEMVQIHSQAGF
jgi:hypothetical protein